MPFLAAGALIGGLGAGAVAGGMTAVGGAMLGGAIGSMVQGQSDAKKAASAASAAAKNSQVDINALDEQTRAIAKKNAEDSAALERSMTPEVPQLRTAANQAVLNGIGGDPNQANLANFVMNRFGQPMVGNGTLGQINTPLLNEAIAKARSDLALGGQLSLDQRNEATRRGAAQAGRMTGRLGMGRDLSARDLGLTSYGVEQQRLQNAMQGSGLELNREGMNLGRDTTLLNFGLNRDIANGQNYLSQFGALNSYYNNLRQQDLAAAAYGQSIAPPTVGLDPSAVANLTMANKNNQTIADMNAANIKAKQAQNWMGFGGQLLGYGSGMNFGNNGVNVPNATSSAGTWFS